MRSPWARRSRKSARTLYADAGIVQRRGHGAIEVGAAAAPLDRSAGPTG